MGDFIEVKPRALGNGLNAQNEGPRGLEEMIIF